MPSVVTFPPVNGVADATTSQLKQALAARDPAGLVRTSLPADDTALAAIGWVQQSFPSGGALYVFVKSTLGYTDLQMSEFYATVKTYQPNV